VFNLDPPPGFHGLNPDLPLTWYQRKLPHARQDGATYFVTSRLADSLPKAKLEELSEIRRSLLGDHQGLSKEELDEKLAKETIKRIEKWLDLGAGECQLKIPACRNEVASAIEFFDGDRYELGCFIVMPNHFHVVVKPLKPQQVALEDILQSWKRHSARKINKIVGRVGTLWQPESYDRIVRDEEHLYRIIQYIGRNPKMGNQKSNEFVLWIRPDWEARGWGFRAS
jgi:REP element-mobilizing transposase RayT